MKGTRLEALKLASKLLQASQEGGCRQWHQEIYKLLDSCKHHFKTLASIKTSRPLQPSSRATLTTQHMHAHPHIYTRMHTHSCTHTCMHTHLCMHMHARTHTHNIQCAHTNRHKHICTHTQYQMRTYFLPTCCCCSLQEALLQIATILILSLCKNTSCQFASHLCSRLRCLTPPHTSSHLLTPPHTSSHLRLRLRFKSVFADVLAALLAGVLSVLAQVLPRSGLAVPSWWLHDSWLSVSHPRMTESNMWLTHMCDYLGICKCVFAV